MDGGLRVPRLDGQPHAEAMGKELTHQWVIWDDENPFKIPHEICDTKEEAESKLYNYIQGGHIISGWIQHRKGYKDFNPVDSI